MSTHAPAPVRHREWKIGCKVYIGNLSEGASKADIEGAFSKFGPLRNVWVARNPPGFAFVEFEDGRDAEDACRHLDGTRIAGARIKAEMSHGRTRRGRGGGPPGFGRPPPYPMGGYGGPPVRGPMGHTRGGPYNGHHAADYPYPPPPPPHHHHHHASRGGYAGAHHHHGGYMGHGAARERHHGGPPAPAHHRGPPRSPIGNGGAPTKDSFRHYSRSRSNSLGKSPPPPMRARPRTPPSRTPTPVDRH